ncbi:MAG: hypothetical protein LJE93_14185 [Acidobacteria bacterium]|jgi:hypothetical protein|nr:hypothetical protein [Acidobacteriota bacterium]
MTLGLVSLDCPSCGSALRGEGLDTIFFCEHCGDAAVLEKDGLEMVESSALMPSAGRSAKTWRPAWLIEADVAVRERVGHRGRRRGEWEGRRRFVIPAFAMPLGDLTRLARALSEAAESTGEVPREPIHGGTLALDDAVTLVRHLVVGDEVRKSDMLASVTVDVDVVMNRLAAIPFEPVAHGLRCSITGVSVNVDR